MLVRRNTLNIMKYEDVICTYRYRGALNDSGEFERNKKNKKKTIEIRAWILTILIDAHSIVGWIKNNGCLVWIVIFLRFLGRVEANMMNNKWLEGYIIATIWFYFCFFLNNSKQHMIQRASKSVFVSENMKNDEDIMDKN